MSSYQENIIRHVKRQKTPQFEETEQMSKPDSDMAGMLELSDQVFKTTSINMLRALIDKADSVQQMGNVTDEKWKF